MAEKHENIWISALKDWIRDKYVIFLLLMILLVALKDIFGNDLYAYIVGKERVEFCEYMGWGWFSCITR